MVEIGGKPIIWHIMKMYSSHQINDFIICLGYKGYVIKEYFVNYFLHVSDVSVDISKNALTVLDNSAEPWRVTLVDTGENTMTGGRLKRVKKYLDDGDFCMTYGDGLSDVNITTLIEYHTRLGKLATVTATQPPGRFGVLVADGPLVTTFDEKPSGDGRWINGGFFVLSPKALDYIQGDETPWEREPMERLARERQLVAYSHSGFWQPMDTVRERNYLEDLWRTGRAPWKVWE